MRAYWTLIRPGACTASSSLEEREDAALQWQQHCNL
jgi:hypothetical protein